MLEKYSTNIFAPLCNTLPILCTSSFCVGLAQYELIGSNLEPRTDLVLDSQRLIKSSLPSSSMLCYLCHEFVHIYMHVPLSNIANCNFCLVPVLGQANNLLNPPANRLLLTPPRLAQISPPLSVAEYDPKCFFSFIRKESCFQSLHQVHLFCDWCKQTTSPPSCLQVAGLVH